MGFRMRLRRMTCIRFLILCVVIVGCLAAFYVASTMYVTVERTKLSEIGLNRIGVYMINKHNELTELTLNRIGVYVTKELNNITEVSLNMIIENVTNEHNKLIDLALTRIGEQPVRYPQEPYYVVPNLLTASSKNVIHGDNVIVLYTQTSLNNFFNVINLSKQWGGKISVALFSFGDEIIHAVHYAILMQMCHEHVRHKMDLHLVYPISRPPPTVLSPIYNMDYNCSTLMLLRQKHSEENYALNISYPLNILRNVAMMYSMSEYIFGLDVDFVPSKGMKKEMEKFLTKRKLLKTQKIAYVIPCFESNITFYKPLSKKEIVAAVKKGSVRQFAIKKCPECQTPTNYNRWLSLPYPSETNASYYATFTMLYEPFYVATRENIPMFEPKFKQYGYDRVSQACEAHYSGYDFAVMNNLFVIHDGFKDPKTYYKWKFEQNKNNSKMFRNIIQPYFKIRYPYSNRTCAYAKKVNNTTLHLKNNHTL